MNVSTARDADPGSEPRPGSAERVPHHISRRIRTGRVSTTATTPAQPQRRLHILSGAWLGRPRTQPLVGTVGFERPTSSS